MRRLKAARRRIRALLGQSLKQLKRVARRVAAPAARAVAGTFAGGISISTGTAMVYLPAGFIVAGVLMIAYCLILIDVRPKGR